MKNSRILFTWLGMTDLRASQGELSGGNLGPIGQAVETFKFSEVHLLSDMEESANLAYCEWLQGLSDAEIVIHPHRLSSPMNFSEIYEAVVETLQKVENNPLLRSGTGRVGQEKASEATSPTGRSKNARRDVESGTVVQGQVPEEREYKLATSSNHKKYKSFNHQIVYHISPGTSAMAAIWIILAKSAYPAELIQSSEEEGAKIISVPFEIAADYNPALILGHDDDILRISQGLPPEAPEFDAIIHRCREMKDAVTKSRIVAMHDIPVLITGESGTGKELFARAIHASSKRKNGPFIEVNCGAIPENLIESEFFGHKKGAFTGAVSDRSGYIESANGGTLFLDEIGELPLNAQVKLLRVLQEKSVTKVGASEPSDVDIRIISATNRKLIEEVAEGQFREDLFHRIAIGVFQLPSLRERRGDLNLLIDHFVIEINCEFRKINGELWKDRKLSANARNALLQHSWPGNIRELRNTLSRILLWSRNSTIRTREVADAIFAKPQVEESSSLFNPALLDQPDFKLDNLLGNIAVEYIEEALKKTGGNKSRASKLLGFSNYQTLNNWLQKYS